MKLRTILSVGLLCSLLGCTQHPYQVSGHLEGVETDTVIIMVQSENFMRTERFDTIALNEGRFGFDVATDGVRLFTIVAKPAAGGQMALERCISLLAVPGEYVVVEGTLDNYTMSGSRFFQDLSEVKPALDAASREMTELRSTAMQRMQDGENNDSLNVWLATEAHLIAERMNNIAWQYIQAHPDNNVSAYLITCLGQERMSEAMDLLSDGVKQGVMAPYLQTIVDLLDSKAKRIEAAQKIRVGVEAPDFTLNDLNGRPLALSSLRGQYVVLDFWGSWCGWCIKGFPAMKEAYARHKGKVEFLGIGCNDTEKRWKAAVEKNQLPWLNVLNEGDVDVSAMYAVDSYPTKIVVDPEGKIAMIVVGEKPEFYEELATLLE